MNQEDYKKEDLINFQNSCPELFKAGKLKYMSLFYCPISIANVEALEYTRAEFESIELLILKLYDAGLHTAEAINEVTALDKKLVRKMLTLEENAYKHIKDGKLTELGQISLKERINHVIYEVVKEIEFDAVTGSIIRHELEQRKDKLFKGANFKGDTAVPQKIIEVDEKVKNEITNRLDEYKHAEIGVLDKNIKEIIDVKTSTLRYTRAYAVEFENLIDPMIILKGRIFNKEKKVPTIIWKPISISLSNCNYLKSINCDTTYYIVRDDAHFEYLKHVISRFNLDYEVNEEDEYTEEIELRDDIDKYALSLSDELS
ncbi:MULTISPECIES: hypothetical protein [Clostridium]|uniref:hypothetical protein n=1 Tax=Clostridium TaxID=1485 RepID=UPI0008249217|nr:MULTISPECIES: hypothetical protein [Clostridium]PJI06845.1 hypothetical protein CUB90_02715 [Clostridium sp. CT7]